CKREIEQADRELAALAAAAALRESLAAAEAAGRAIESGEAAAARLAPLVCRIERLAGESDRARPRAAALAGLEGAPALAPEAAAAVKVAERAIAEWAEAHPACPICGGKITAQRLLVFDAPAHGHEGGGPC